MDEIEMILEDVADEVLDLELLDGDRPPTEDCMVCIIHLTGDWASTVVLSCERPFARRISRIMFDVDGEMTDHDLEDAVGELTNIVAGNLRTLRPERSGGLSPPLVVCGTRFTLLGLEEIFSYTVSFEGAPLKLSLFQTPEGEVQLPTS